MTEKWKEFGVHPVINACGTVTRLGGARMTPEVVAGWVTGTEHSVSMDQLQAAACRWIVAASGAEAGLIVSGASAGLLLGTAAILAGHDLSRMERLPDTTGMPNEILVARTQRTGYDHAVRTAGAKLVEVGMDEMTSGSGVRMPEVWEYEAAITPQTVGVLYTLTDNALPTLADVMHMARIHSLPVLVDAAAQLPPIDNLKTILATGADLVVFSGGKAMRGPADTGILCGKRALIGSAFLQMMDNDELFDLWTPPVEFVDKHRLKGLPRQGIGRVAKTSPSDIFALLTALDGFSTESLTHDIEMRRAWLKKIEASVSKLAYCRIHESDSGIIMTVEPRTSVDLIDLCTRLREAAPPIFVGTAELRRGMITINPACLVAEEVEPLAVRLRETLETVVT
ncbi:MAG: aminotransferase class V-fold PLP-dependent enzyme [Planctomycetales bacterium]|nr:aminotransferase class V-fold PLP-dependent enzyme [Planctomycetales bacterium]MCA9166264.1 aminotransferase class V-fold PLP-dependent enzyme [Planctomycetales bacterium]